jgi:CHAT domain-containing protein/tetratricopeptide (TPR) repeat protein
MKCFLVTAPCPSPTQIFKGIRSLCFGLAVVFILTFVLTMIAVTSSGQSNAQQQDEESLRDVLPSMSRVQELLKSGKVEEATALLKEVVRTTGQRLGEDNPNYAPFAMMLANLYVSQNRFNEADPLFDQALKIYEKFPPKDDPLTTNFLEGASKLYVHQAQNSKAEPILRHVLEIRLRTLPEGDPRIVQSLKDLGMLYLSQARVLEAEPLLKRALSIKKKTIRQDDAETIAMLDLLGVAYDFLGKKNEAGKQFERAASSAEKLGGKGTTELAFALVSLARFYESKRRFNDAERLYRRVLAAQDPERHSEDSIVPLATNLLAGLMDSMGRHSEAQALWKHSLDLLELSVGKNHPNVAVTLVGLARSQLSTADWSSALSNSGRAVDILITREIHGESQQREDASYVENFHRSDAAKVYLGAASHLVAENHSLVEEGFVMAQFVARTKAADALAQMSARIAAGSDSLAETVRGLQDMQSQWRAADQLLSKALGVGDKTLEESARRRMSDLDVKIQTIDERLHQEFPRYTELTGARPVSISDTQSLLRPDEALVSFTFSDNEAYLFVVRKEFAKFSPLPVKRGEVSKLVSDLRASLDARGRPFNKLPSFDVAKAHELYQVLFGPADELIREATHLIVVADGPLQSLPPSLLVTEALAGPGSSTKFYHRYLDVAWLARRQAISVMPAVSSLVLLRRHTEAHHGNEPYVGFGDPDFGDGVSAGRIRGVRLANLFRGGAANMEGLRRLPPLPDTAIELREEAKILGAPRSSVYIERNATVTKLKSLDLTDTRVIAFATHGLIAGDLPALAEPALALTPPAAPTKDDDGLLRASEVAQLKLNADVVLLSACNTAASDGKLGAEGLSGLARAFFYAGARSVLVSHWSVDSKATMKLMTSAFNALKGDPTVGRAEAFRHAMLTMIDDADKSKETLNWAHPLYWAPFVVIGEGR